MKTIKVGLSTKSISLAIKRLENIKNITLLSMIKQLLRESCEWIIERANTNVERSGRGSEVIDEIKSSWRYEIDNKGKAKIINEAEKAVYVEFGVGIVGQNDPHPNAGEAGYDYNRESPAKDYAGSWHFFSNKDELDIPLSSIEWGLYPTRGDSRERLSVFTSGAEGSMYLYNAMMDFVSSGTVKKLWREIKEMYGL